MLGWSTTKYSSFTPSSTTSLRLSLSLSLAHVDYYRSMMTKRLDVPIPPTPMAAPQSSTSPIPTASSSFHQQRLSSSTLSPTSSMAQLTTSSPSVLNQPQDPLKNKLSQILSEQRALQQRKEELERMVRARIVQSLVAHHPFRPTDRTTCTRLLTVCIALFVYFLVVLLSHVVVVIVFFLILSFL